MIIFIYVILALTAVSLGAGLYMARFASRRNPKIPDYWTHPEALPPFSPHIAPKDLPTMEQGQAFLLENAGAPHTITSRDGLRLQGHYIKAHPDRKSQAIVLQVHGYRSHPLNDFAGSALAFCEKGFDLFLIDQRALGGSEGKYITFGILERYDVADWCRYLEQTFPGIPVILDGVSMGATTVLLAAGEPLPKNVRAVIADCGYASPAAICKKVLKQWFHLPPFPIYYAAVLWLRLLTGVWFGKFPADGYATGDCATALEKTKLPILFAHGTGDTFVPYTMSCAAYGHCDRDRCELVTVEGAEHGLSWFEGREAYDAALARLLERAGIQMEL